MPDLYQGTEFWDFSLVDPDNRRPGRFRSPGGGARGGDGARRSCCAHWRDGRVKQAVIARALAFQATRIRPVCGGTYVPLKIEGKLSQHAFGFARLYEGRAAVAVVTRLSAKLEGLTEQPLLPASAWQGTAIILPRNLQGRRFEDVFGGSGHTGHLAALLLSEVLSKLPVALLEVT